MLIKSKTNRKTPIIATAVVLCILGIGIVGTYKLGIWPFHNRIQSTIEEENKSDATNPQTKASPKGEITQDPALENKNTDEIPVSTETSVSITELSQNNGKVAYSAEIINPGTSGTCSAVFTNDVAKPVTRTTSTTSSACAKVEIPELEFSAVGTWTLTLRYYTNVTQAVATKTIEVK